MSVSAELPSADERCRTGGPPRRTCLTLRMKRECRRARGDAHLVRSKVFEPTVPGQIEDIDVAATVAFAGSDDANDLGIHLLDQLITEIQDMLGDVLDTDPRDEIERRCKRVHGR